MKRFIFLLVGMIIAFSSVALAAIMPKVVVSDPNASVQQSIKVSLNAGNNPPAGDMWLVCEQQSKYYHFDINSWSWVLDSSNLNINEIRPSFSGQLFSFNPVEIGFNGLHGGRSVFYFAADTIANAKIDSNVVIKAVFADISMDCLVRNIEQIQDNGAEGRFRITLNYNVFEGFSTRFVRGQSYPDGPWVEYGPIGNLGYFELDWPHGKDFDFSYGVDRTDWVDPTCSQFLYDGHLRVTLGEEKICSQSNTGDSIVTGIYDMGGGKKRIYLNFSSLPFNHQSAFVKGQSAPNSAWINYRVIDEYPCRYFEISNWPSGRFMEFSYGVVREDGSEQWIDPMSSEYFYNGHIRVLP